MADLIDRQAAIDAMKDALDPHIVQFVKAKMAIEALPSAQPDNQTNLCDSCDCSYPDCPSKYDDVIFGNGIGNDNICACNKYKPSAQPEIIRCKDCKYRDENWRRVSVRWLPCMDIRTGSNWYCGSAERGEQDG